MDNDTNGPTATAATATATAAEGGEGEGEGAGGTTSSPPPKDQEKKGKSDTGEQVEEDGSKESYREASKEKERRFGNNMKRIHLKVPDSKSMMKAGGDARKAISKALSSRAPNLGKAHGMNMSMKGKGLSLSKSASSRGGGFASASSPRGAKSPAGNTSFGSEGEAGGAEDASKPIYPYLKEMWEKSVDELPVAKDIPRLARRVEVIDEAVEKPLFQGVPFEGPDDQTRSASAEVLAELITALARKIDNDRAGEIKTKVDEIAKGVTEVSDMTEVAESMIEVVGPDSGTVRALKVIHQDIVGFCTVELKQQLTSKYQTKDVRTPDGWRIQILFSEERVQAIHSRREQSVDFGSNQSNHWEFQWELRMFFSPHFKNMNAAQVRVTDLLLSETMDKELEDELKRTIVGDILVL